MNRMREIRKRRGESLSALGERTGISPSVLSRYENGKLVPSVEKALLVAKALGVSLDYLVNNDAPLAVSGKSSASEAQ